MPFVQGKLDLLAYKPQTNELLVIECKSCLNSSGVCFKEVFRHEGKRTNRYKLFNKPKLRRTVLHRLRHQLIKSGLCRPRVKIRLCLVAGKIVGKDKAKLQEWFKKKNWDLRDSTWFDRKFEELRKSRYEDDVAFVVAKLTFPKSAP